MTYRESGLADEPDLVPELLVTDLAESLTFWCDVCQFELRSGSAAAGFAYVVRGGAHAMLEQLGAGRNWVTGALERPLGRGINFEIKVPAIAPIVDALGGANQPLFMAPEIRTYETISGAVTVHQFVVQDPDGYALRFSALVADEPSEKNDSASDR
jgi:catechol 2,3-dioxygenase-like lactoylglutathione lyase family enzyme